jgi:hypothetical protein
MNRTNRQFSMATPIMRTVLLGTSSLLLAACGGNDVGNPASEGAADNGVPQVDTGWTKSTEGESLRLQRQLNQLTLSFTLSPKSGGVSATIVAKASPCLGGKGEQEAEVTFTPMSSDDASALSDIRDRIDRVVGQVDDRCDLPDEVVRDITAGFDGMYFRSERERAAISGS